MCVCVEVHYCPVLIISISYQVSQLLANTRHGSAAAGGILSQYGHRRYGGTATAAATALGFCVERGEEVITLIISSICHHTTPPLDWHVIAHIVSPATGDSA